LNTNNGRIKSELGAQRPAKSATDEQLKPKPFQPQLFEVNALAGRYAPSSDFAWATLNLCLLAGGSRADRFTAAAAEFCAARIATAASLANHFYRPWLTPIERRGRANGNAALSAESYGGRVLLFATRARHCGWRRGGWTNANILNAWPFVSYKYES